MSPEQIMTDSESIVAQLQHRCVDKLTEAQYEALLLLLQRLLLQTKRQSPQANATLDLIEIFFDVCDV
ncbi:MAG: hypothetical protein ABW168_28670 [Sedimenticola sp.]